MHMLMYVYTYKYTLINTYKLVNRNTIYFSINRIFRSAHSPICTHTLAPAVMHSRVTE